MTKPSPSDNDWKDKPELHGEKHVVEKAADGEVHELPSREVARIGGSCSRSMLRMS